MACPYTEKSLKKGIKIESEHTKNPYVQKKIAKDHLKENKDYYKYSSTSGKSKEYLISDNKKNIYCEKNEKSLSKSK